MSPYSEAVSFAPLKFLAVVEPRGSLPCSQEPYPTPDSSVQRLQTSCFIHTFSLHVTWTPVARIAGRDVRKLPQHAMYTSFLFGFFKTTCWQSHRLLIVLAANGTARQAHWVVSRGMQSAAVWSYAHSSVAFRHDVRMGSVVWYIGTNVWNGPNSPTRKKEGHILDDRYLRVRCHKGLNTYLTQVKLEFCRHIFYKFYSEQKLN